MEVHRVPPTSAMDVWPECFQDLRSWCHTDQDELNTPQITISVQDEFNFSLDGQVSSGNWGLSQTPVEINDLWVNQDPLLASPDTLMIKDEENNNFEIQNNFSTAFMKGDTSNDLQWKVTANTSVASNSVLKTKGNVLLSQVSILPEDVPVVLDSGDNCTNYIKLNSSTSARLGSGGRLIKDESRPADPDMTTGARPKLQLKIPQPQGQMGGGDLTTPEVLKPLTDLASSDFDLLKFVCGDSENVNRTTTVPLKKGEVSEVAATDHDYVDGNNSIIDEQIYIKCEPVSPSSLGVSSSRASSSNMPMDLDEEIIDDSLDEEEEEEGEEWFPSSERVKKGGEPGRRRGRKTSSLDSSDGLNGRYRTLRDKNNEASRRSRLNRKQRDHEMRRYKSELEKKNVELKVKADRMEALVKDMRAILLRTVRSRNQPQALHP